MSSLKFQLDNLNIELSHAEITLTKPKISLKALVQFTCPSCKRKTLSIERSDIENAGKFTSSGGKPHIGVLDAVKRGFDIAKERKTIEGDQKADFIEYIKKLSIWRRKNEGKFDFAKNGAETSISVECGLCRARYSFTVIISNPIDTDWASEENFTEIFEKRGIENNAANLNLLESICASSIPYTEHASDFLLRIDQLNEDRQKIAKFLDELKASVGKADFESETAVRWLGDLSSSLTDVGKILQKKLEEELVACLKSIAEFSSSSIED